MYRYSAGSVSLDWSMDPKLSPLEIQGTKRDTIEVAEVIFGMRYDKMTKSASMIYITIHADVVLKQTENRILS